MRQLLKALYISYPYILCILWWVVILILSL
nr:MAG TPA: hypothetical protein [Caudoviricetes sp.]